MFVLSLYFVSTLLSLSSVFCWNSNIKGDRKFHNDGTVNGSPRRSMFRKSPLLPHQSYTTLLVSRDVGYDLLVNKLRGVETEQTLTIPDVVESVKTNVFSPSLSGLERFLNTNFDDISWRLGVKLHPVIDSVLPIIKAIPPQVSIPLTTVVTYLTLFSLLKGNKESEVFSPYPLKRYDPYSARAYFDANPQLVLSRAAEVFFLSARFSFGLLLDYLNKNLSKNSPLRASELTVLLTRLGPSFIKIGQSLSIRTDLLSPAYVNGLKALQDQVPPFSSSKARSMLMEEWGVSAKDIFESLDEEPIAAASLGQVYKGVLKDDGRTVAVKVQRPAIMNQIALDMHLIREIAPVLRRTFNLNTDLVATVDKWGIGFVDELNYLDEAENSIQFNNNIQSTPLANVVFAPPVVDDLTTERILVTEWIDGERLDKSTKEDVTVLCSIAMNSYLTMMLETGVLHCDPHPGNLLRTNDGRLCILDWGMVTRLDPGLQYDLIEHMAHLTSADYGELPRDLLTLGFIPESKAHLIADSGVVETLADIYGAWTAGGGAAKINVNKVISQLQDLTETNGNLFQIPAYFAYIAKSFSVLEGIGLSNDEDYSIINECLPYVSQRLLTDKSARTGRALSTFIFGADKNDIDRILDYDRIEQLVTGFGNYTTSSSGELLGTAEDINKVQKVERLADQVLDLIVSEEETPLQKILIEQMSKIISSSSQSVWAELRERSGRLPSGRSVLGTLVDPIGFWRTSPIIRLNERDIKTLETTRDLITLVQRQGNSNNAFVEIETLSNQEILELFQILSRKIWNRRRGVSFTGRRLAMSIIQMTADKLEKGQRDLVVLPQDQRKNEERETFVRLQGPSETYDTQRSKRLTLARQLLATLEKE